MRRVTKMPTMRPLIGAHHRDVRLRSFVNGPWEEGRNRGGHGEQDVVGPHGTRVQQRCQ
jgi:hypothetical protein